MCSYLFKTTDTSHGVIWVTMKCTFDVAELACLPVLYCAPPEPIRFRADTQFPLGIRSVPSGSERFQSVPIGFRAEIGCLALSAQNPIGRINFFKKKSLFVIYYLIH